MKLLLIEKNLSNFLMHLSKILMFVNCGFRYLKPLLTKFFNKKNYMVKDFQLFSKFFDSL